VRIIAQAAASGDLPAVAQLLADGSVALVAERGGAIFLNRETLAPPFEEQLSRMLADPAALVAVGTLDDVIMGTALARVETLRGGATLARVEFLWVDPEAREVGLGGELMDLAKEWAHAAGASHIDAYALPGNREAKNFLETAGFSARLLVMHRKLGEPSG
jgi:ribosomal protein S18 acetylase RimI-like enzyme